jgi:hypothetical protein
MEVTENIADNKAKTILKAVGKVLKGLFLGTTWIVIILASLLVIACGGISLVLFLSFMQNGITIRY